MVQGPFREFCDIIKSVFSYLIVLPCRFDVRPLDVADVHVGLVPLEELVDVDIVHVKDLNGKSHIIFIPFKTLSN